MLHLLASSTSYLYFIILQLMNAPAILSWLINGKNIVFLHSNAVDDTVLNFGFFFLIFLQSGCCKLTTGRHVQLHVCDLDQLDEDWELDPDQSRMQHVGKRPERAVL